MLLYATLLEAIAAQLQNTQLHNNNVLLMISEIPKTSYTVMVREMKKEGMKQSRKKWKK